MSTPISRNELSGVHEHLGIDYEKSGCTPLQAGFAALAGYEVGCCSWNGENLRISSTFHLYHRDFNIIGKFHAREEAWKAAYDHLASQSKAQGWTVDEIIEREG